MPAIVEMKPGEDKRWKQEKHCNGDSCVNHDGLFAVESVFDLDSLALCNGSPGELALPLIVALLCLIHLFRSSWFFGEGSIGCITCPKSKPGQT